MDYVAWTTCHGLRGMSARYGLGAMVAMNVAMAAAAARNFWTLGVSSK